MVSLRCRRRRRHGLVLQPLLRFLCLEPLLGRRVLLFSFFALNGGRDGRAPFFRHLCRSTLGNAATAVVVIYAWPVLGGTSQMCRCR